MDDALVEAVARAIEEADVGYSIRLTRLVDGEAEYTATIDGQVPRIFPRHSEASEYVGEHRRLAKARAVIPIVAEACAALSASIGEQYGEDEAGWFECTETVSMAIRRLASTPD